MQLTVRDKAVYLNTGGVDWNSDKPWLCLVHGAALDHSVWVLFTRYFARQGYNLIVPDLPGHGASAGEVPESIEAMAEWVLELLDVVIDSVPGASATDIRLAGHSMGSLVALQAASARDCFSHLLMLGTAVPMPVGDALLNAARDNDQAAVDMVSIYGHAYQSRLGGNPVAGINVLQTGMALLASAPPGVMHAGLNACNNYTTGLEQATKVKARTTLILGEKDMMTPPRGTAKLQQALGSDVVTLARCGHMMLAEQPEQTLQAMLKALD